MQLNIVFIIIIITVGISLMAFQNRDMMYKLMMNPYDVKHRNQFYRVLSSGFIHIDFQHLFFNMFVFWSFGQAVLNYYQYTFYEKGVYYFAILYLGGIIFSDLPSYIKHQNNPAFNSLGASGAVSAVLFTYIFFNPLGQILVFFIPMPAIVWGVAYMIYSVYAGKKGGDNINHSAHIYGAVFGVLFTMAMKPELALRFFKNISSFF
jgi:membrane associated rhomboid family serine protease